jgi:excisionase family DNA binding protein
MTALGDLGDRMFAYVPEAAQILGRDERTVRRAIRNGQVPAAKTGTRYLVPTAWLRAQAGVSGPPPAAPAVLDPDALAELVADRVVRRVLGMLAALGRGPGAAAAGDSRSEP